jgi:hypothetical protein
MCVCSMYVCMYYYYYYYYYVYVYVLCMYVYVCLCMYLYIYMYVRMYVRVYYVLRTNVYASMYVLGVDLSSLFRFVKLSKTVEDNAVAYLTYVRIFTLNLSAAGNEKLTDNLVGKRHYSPSRTHSTHNTLGVLLTRSCFILVPKLKSQYTTGYISRPFPLLAKPG